MSLWNAVCSVHLCFSVRNRTHPLYEMTHKQLAGEVFLSQSAQSSRRFLAHISSTQKAFGIQRTQRPHPPAPLRMERGVVCEVTPIGLLMIGDKLLNIRRKRRGISVFTPLSIRRGAGGEASVAVTFCDIGWLNVSVECCVFCSSVFSVRKRKVLCEKQKYPMWRKKR